MEYNLENFLSLFNLLNKQPQNNDTTPQQSPIPKEVLDQYPYGEFPSRYTKIGQENIRAQSEKRYSYENLSPETETKPNKKSEDLDISSLLPLIQLMSNKKRSPNTQQLLLKLLFKDNKEMEQIFNLFSSHKQNPHEIDNTENFPNTNKVNISSLKRID